MARCDASRWIRLPSSKLSELLWNVTLDNSTNGSQDATINTPATAVKALTGKVMIRFAHEMNGNCYPWDGVHNGNDATAPPKYIAAFRHVHDVFAAAGVTNALFGREARTWSLPVL